MYLVACIIRIRAPTSRDPYLSHKLRISCANWQSDAFQFSGYKSCKNVLLFLFHLITSNIIYHCSLSVLVTNRSAYHRMSCHYRPYVVRGWRSVVFNGRSSCLKRVVSRRDGVNSACDGLVSSRTTRLIDRTAPAVWVSVLWTVSKLRSIVVRAEIANYMFDYDRFTFCANVFSNESIRDFTLMP